MLLTIVLGLVWFVVDEVKTSRRQAAWLSGLVPELHFELKPGPSPAIRFPGAGPFDERLGYRRLPETVQRLTGQGFTIAAQARMSPKMIELVDRGLFAPYREKTQAGLSLRDCRGQTLAAARYPERRYERFEAVPPLLVDALLFIENRDLLDARRPLRNPAVEWDRFGKAIADQALRQLDESHAAAGASTLATQIEKYRHSPEGRTGRASEKLRQMASASLRAYLDGENTLARRREIVVDYLNTVPLSAQGGFGEVNGIGDGLWAWYGRDFAEVNRLLLAPVADGGPPLPQRRALAFKQALVPLQALAFKQALALMVAQRRPSYYLAEGEPALRQLTDSYLRVMADAGVITPGLRDAALPLTLTLQTEFNVARPASFVARKAANSVRGRLQTLLAVPRSYDLDRLDLTVDSPLDGEVQRAATLLLRGLGDPAAARAAGLYGFRLLSEGDDTSKIMFSFTLFERGEHSNLLRVQTDNFDQPFDLNEGVRLDLGSTAKLRTLISYLELVAVLHQRWNGLSAEQLAALTIGSRDALSRWARDHLARSIDKSLPAMLDAAMERSYSASPHEGFFTGGGLHHFDNFEPEDNGRTMSVREALTRSVNLVFIRMMRDVVQHVLARGDSTSAALLDDPTNPQRQQYIARFADKEGRVFIARFHRKYAGKSAQEAENLLVHNARPTPTRLAATFYGLRPEGSLEQLQAFIERHLPNADLSDAALQSLRSKFGPGLWSLADRGYLAGQHPLELWLVAYLHQHPQATRSEAVAASVAQRQETYQWLFKTRHKGAQDARIRNLLEVDAFVEIHKAWRRLGYPFESLTPSYASALGASGDRPAALAELMGIIVNRGMRLPVTRVGALRFAQGTPYETQLAYQPNQAERVLQPEIADVLRRALIGVVEKGTAKRLQGSLVRRDGSVVEIGGKTGTGDHRFDTYGRGGQVLSSRIVNRSATLVFLIGERHFGTVMAFATEPYAANYKFTSALPAQLLKVLTPALLPLVDGDSCAAAPQEPGSGGPKHNATR
ncbi:MAG TPA: transglycosylase domain-containing protein [Aquabacterium sp.]|nr:transglycosylase domain-containing protein [Aquabacterium sp.]